MLWTNRNGFRTPTFTLNGNDSWVYLSELKHSHVPTKKWTTNVGWLHLVSIEAFDNKYKDVRVEIKQTDDERKIRRALRTLVVSVPDEHVVAYVHRKRG